MIMHRQYMMYACLKCCSSIILCDAVVVLCCNCYVMVQRTLRVPVVEAQRGFEEMLDSLETVLKDRLGAETMQDLDADDSDC